MRIAFAPRFEKTHSGPMSFFGAENVAGLIWVREGRYGMRSGEYRVAKVYLDGATLYTLYFGNQCLKVCADWSQAQDVAAEHAETGGAHAID